MDFAPPNGFVDVCSRDSRLCEFLTKGYPPSVQTIGYFVSAQEWQQYLKEHTGFSRYLIAQKGRLLSAEDFAGFKNYVHSQQGKVEDHTSLINELELHGQTSLGIISESEDSISFGTILKLSQPPAAQEKLLAVINIALQLKGESLSLYVYDTIKDANDTERIKALAKQWLQCIRAQNSS